MRLRTIAFLPPAVGITCLLLVSISSLVSAVEDAWASVDREGPEWIRVQYHESECEGLLRELQTLSASLSAALAGRFTSASDLESRSCDVGPGCTRSPLLCPVTQEADVTREFARLRSALHQRCGFPLALTDDAWSNPVWGHSWGDAATTSRDAFGEISASSGDRCPAADQDFGSDRGVATASDRFVF